MCYTDYNNGGAGDTPPKEDVMIVWLGQLGGGNYEGYEMGYRKKDWNSQTGFFVGTGRDTGLLQSFCVDHWERMTGIKLKPGELVKCKITKRDFAVGTDENGNYVRKGFTFEVV